MQSSMSATSSPAADAVRSVMIHNLPVDINEDWVRKLFSPIGDIESMRFHGAGQANIVFTSTESAIRACRLDGFVASGKAVVVELVSTDDPTATVMSPAAEHPRQGYNMPTHKNLYVLNLPLDATTDQLAALFGSYGVVSHCVILAMLDGQARRRGFIDMGAAEEAKAAIEGLNGFVWRGYPIEVSYAIVQRSGGPFDPSAGRNVIKRNVPRNRFNTGPRRVPSDSTGIPFGSTPHSPSAASHRMIYSSSGPPSPAYSDVSATSSNDSTLTTDPCTLFVSNLDPIAIPDDQRLRDLFVPFGNITSCILSRHESGASRGFGMVSFSTETETTQARLNLDGKLINGQRIMVHNFHFQRGGDKMLSLPARRFPTSPSYSPLSSSINLPPPTSGYFHGPIGSIGASIISADQAAYNPSNFAYIPSPSAYAPRDRFSNPLPSIAYRPSPSPSPTMMTAPLSPVYYQPSPVGMVHAFPSPANPVAHQHFPRESSAQPPSTPFFRAAAASRPVVIKDPKTLITTTPSAPDALPNFPKLGEAFELKKSEPPRSRRSSLEQQKKAAFDGTTVANAAQGLIPVSSSHVTSASSQMESPHSPAARKALETPAAHSGAWSPYSSASTTTLGLDGLSPESVRTTSTASTLNTPESIIGVGDHHLRIVSGLDGKHAWADRRGEADTAWSTQVTKGLDGEKLFESLDSNVDLTMDATTKHRITLGPVGFEKLSSPKRDHLSDRLAELNL